LKEESHGMEKINSRSSVESEGDHNNLNGWEELSAMLLSYTV